jgi:type I restriction enzyme M protein
MKKQSELPLFGDIKPILGKSDRLLHVFQAIHNHIYANEGLSSEQTFAEMMKVLSLKVVDEQQQDSHRLFYLKPGELEIGGGDEFLMRIRKLEKKTKEEFKGRLVESPPLSLKTETLAFVVSQLQIIDLKNSSRDVKGIAFQKFVSAEHRRGRGQFFTPEQVVDFCVRVLNPRADEIVMDPACGTGGFISQAASYVRQKQPKARATGCFLGTEINAMVSNTAEIRLALEGVENASVLTVDALTSWAGLNEVAEARLGRRVDLEGYVDVIVTNPPFGTQGRITSHNVLSRYTLGRRWDSSGGNHFDTGEVLPGQVPDILFVERCIGLLKPGGRMAIVLPNGDLENASLDYLRAYILREAHLLGVVHLPNDTFVPFGTGVKASVLFLVKKGGRTGKVSRRAFFAQITKLGYTPNKTCAPIYRLKPDGRPVLDAAGEAVLDEDYSTLADACLSFIADGEETAIPGQLFFVDSSNVSSRFDFEYHRPEQRELISVLKEKGACPLGDIVEILKRKSPLLEVKSDQEVQYVELSNINAAYCEISGSTHARVHELPSRASYEIKEGDIITAIAGNSIGTPKHMSALVTKEYDGAICTNGFRILKPGAKLLPLYLLYYLRSPLFLEQVFRFRTGAAIPNISDDDLKNVLVPVPSMKVQIKVADAVARAFALRAESRTMLDSISMEAVFGVGNR